jgi:hypothetical protein
MYRVRPVDESIAKIRTPHEMIVKHKLNVGKFPHLRTLPCVKTNVEILFP